MIRRKFLSYCTLAGAGTLAALKAATASGNATRKTAVYKVSGFTCITCALGLETLLQREKGVLSAKASYPDGTATVVFDAGTITLAAIAKSIESMGFTPQLLHAA